ncbi:hypothetical protein [Spongiactinospora sp. TRM90649]|uniref:hypothetical protein n=1 Tax=Spongiactinospora sp. TRM90649 TaxID=3031114 RepID=UPI0023F621FD|nr:hypothetical protein [Spongiactinospora sp. TRM90649]MDF5754687.1 hypothetical protein [Spongiactinospora sp. TRM90649]
MSRQGRAKAVAVLLVTVGLCGAGVLAAAPMIGNSANAAAEELSAADPTTVLDPPDDNAGPESPDQSDLEPEVTITVTTTPEEPVEVTTTITVTPPPKKPKKTKQPQQQQPQPPVPPVTSAPQSLPSQEIQVPPTATSDPPTPTVSEAVSLPAVTDSPGTSAAPVPSVSQPLPTDLISSPEVAAIELREASPEMDRATLSRQLGIPALVLMLLALFAVLVYESKLRRLAHAAAIRRAGPGAWGRQGAEVPPYAGYPAGPGYVAGYPAPPAAYSTTTVVNLMPVHNYPPQYAQPTYEQAPYEPPSEAPFGPQVLQLPPGSVEESGPPEHSASTAPPGSQPEFYVERVPAPPTSPHEQQPPFDGTLDATAVYVMPEPGGPETGRPPGRPGRPGKRRKPETDPELLDGPGGGEKGKGGLFRRRRSD